VGYTIKVRVSRAGYTGTKTSTVTGTITKQQTVSPAGLGVSFAMRYVPVGSFQRDGTPANISIISNGYWMGETEVTQGLFEAVMDVNPSNFSTNPEDGAADGWKRLPVEKVNWYAAIAFCNKFSLKDGKDPVYSVSGVDWVTLTYSAIPDDSEPDWDAATQDLSKDGYRLPTEMEWMWAAMGADTSGRGKAFAGNTGSIDDNAWYNENSEGSTHQTGYKNANELGLKDMSGNVREWCWDWYGGYTDGPLTDPPGTGSGSRVMRGGGWNFYASNCTVANRSSFDPYFAVNVIGFRVVCP
jgi:formylglycine-generating enzyme required for sulfatase activity